MRARLNRIIYTSLMLISFLTASAQKIYYAPGNENWKSAIPEDSTELIYTVYLLGDIKNSPAGSDNLKLLKNSINKESNQSTVVLLGDIV